VNEKTFTSGHYYTADAITGETVLSPWTNDIQISDTNYYFNYYTGEVWYLHTKVEELCYIPDADTSSLYPHLKIKQYDYIAPGTCNVWKLTLESYQYWIYDTQKTYKQKIDIKELNSEGYLRHETKQELKDGRVPILNVLPRKMPVYAEYFDNIGQTYMDVYAEEINAQDILIDWDSAELMLDAIKPNVLHNTVTRTYRLFDELYFDRGWCVNMPQIAHGADANLIIPSHDLVLPALIKESKITFMPNKDVSQSEIHTDLSIQGILAD
jgi:hypothetical protein